jgi:DNA primase
LLHCPALALDIPLPPAFATLQQPGVPLLIELVELVHGRPDIGTGALVEHFADREEHAALQKLMIQTLPGIDATWRQELRDTVAQLDRAALEQRITDLKQKLGEVGYGGLTTAEKDELKHLLSRVV